VNKEQGTGTEQGTRNKDQGTGTEQGTRNKEQGTRNKEQGTGKRSMLEKRVGMDLLWKSRFISGKEVEGV
jgi:hypothetical protein